MKLHFKNTIIYKSAHCIVIVFYSYSKIGLKTYSDTSAACLLYLILAAHFLDGFSMMK